MFYHKKIFSVVITGFVLLAVSCAHTPEGEAPLTAIEHLELAAVYESKGEIDNALKRYRIAISADKSNPEAYFAYANLNMSIGMLDRAKKAYRKAIGLAPENGIYRNNLGWLYMEQGRHKEAVELVEEALELDPAGDFIYLDTLGVIQTRQKKYALALKSLEAAAASAPAKSSLALIKIYGHMVELHKLEGDGKAGAEVQLWIEALK